MAYGMSCEINMQYVGEDGVLGYSNSFQFCLTLRNSDNRAEIGLKFMTSVSQWIVYHE